MKHLFFLPLFTAALCLFFCGCRTMDDKIKTPSFSEMDFKVEKSGKKFQLFRHRSGKTLKLFSGKRYCSINGKLYFLPHPVSADGKYQVSQLCVEKVIYPLFEEKFSPRSTIKTVILDPGHGGDNSGAVGVKYKEKDLNLSLAREIASSLKKRGFKVRFTREDDRFLTLEERGNFARKENGDVFLSIHHNAGRTGANGIETYIVTPCNAASTNDRETQLHKTVVPGNSCDAQNIHLGALLQENMVKAASRQNRGLRFARFRVLVLSEIPAALIEAGFVSNPQEEQACGLIANQRKIAEGIADSLEQYNAL